jgi:hypothetical protein
MNFNTKPTKTMQTTYLHPWYIAQQKLESITSSELESTLKPKLETTGLKYISETDIAWAAGLFEGEGCLCYRKKRDIFTIVISMTDLDVLEKLGDIWDLKVNGPYSVNNAPSVIKQNKDNGSSNIRKDYYKVETATRDKIFKIVCEMYPYLGIRRREKCDKFIAWYEAKQ